MNRINNPYSDDAESEEFINRMPERLRNPRLEDFLPHEWRFDNARDLVGEKYMAELSEWMKANDVNGRDIPSGVWYIVDALMRSAPNGA